jgi:hypothetical protein
MTYQFWLTVAGIAFAWLFAAGAGLIAILRAEDERKLWAARDHLERLRRSASRDTGKPGA